MFTGIVQAQGTVIWLRRQGEGARLRLRVPAGMMRRLRLGDSLAVNGCCLTVAARGPGRCDADLAAETLTRTSLGELAAGDRVNLEPALRAGDALGGHLMQGHVEGVGRVRELRQLDHDGGWWLRVEVPRELRRYVIWKGSLGVHGISLTVAEWRGGVAGIAIVPHTWRHTNLATLEAGARVNLETDPLARYVEALLAPRRSAAVDEPDGGKHTGGASRLRPAQRLAQPKRR